MRRLFSLFILAAVAVPVAAQEPTPAPRPPRLPRDSTRAFGYMYQFGPDGVSYQAFRRGRLGVTVDLSADPARDSLGARVAGVTPGGPADKAGVREGDLIVRFNGTALSGAAPSGRRERPKGEDMGDVSRPGTRLIELASRLDTGDTVRLEVRRDNQPVNLTVVAGESGLENMVRRFTVEPMPGRGTTRMQIPGGEMLFDFVGAPLANLELVKVNPGLAEYFGTSEGLLVVNVPRDSSLGLKSGDVILSIGGRHPTSPAQAMRILRSYEANEAVSFEVMRMKRRITVSGKMPESRGWSVQHNSLELDMPFMETMPQLQRLKTLPRLMQPFRLMPAPSVRLRQIRQAVET